MEVIYGRCCGLDVHKETVVACVLTHEGKVKKEIRTLKDEWDRLVATFKRYKNIESYEGIKEQYAFSDETIDVIKGLLNEQEISLSSISSEVLREITRFEDFCNIVKLKFQPSERKT